eukprot:TRINITY_DN6223_c0_g1_i1.p2 TRINITY_DN6223_c0_g1~~TRINITY_DN6223_c0_g1_i1.p2  ORF type:complete len:56 (-),score=2.49 TRINITY_DN6223_c0_g1_i1:608-775(-)
MDNYVIVLKIEIETPKMLGLSNKKLFGKRPNRDKTTAFTKGGTFEEKKNLRNLNG